MTLLTAELLVFIYTINRNTRRPESQILSYRKNHHRKIMSCLKIELWKFFCLRYKHIERIFKDGPEYVYIYFQFYRHTIDWFKSAQLLNIQEKKNNLLHVFWNGRFFIFNRQWNVLVFREKITVNCSTIIICQIYTCVKIISYVYLKFIMHVNV